MAVSSTYYLDAPSLSASTAVFLDPSLSSCAPDGFYSDGVIAREQVSCALLPEVPCPSCGTTYDITIKGHPSEPTIDTGNVYYSIDGGPDILLGSLGTNLCRLVGTIYSIPSGSILHLGVKNGSSACVPFDVVETSEDCPVGYSAYCGTINTCTGYTTLFPIVASYYISITADCTGGTYVTCP